MAYKKLRCFLNFYLYNLIPTHTNEFLSIYISLSRQALNILLLFLKSTLTLIIYSQCYTNNFSNYDCSISRLHRTFNDKHNFSLLDILAVLIRLKKKKKEIRLQTCFMTFEMSMMAERSLERHDYRILFAIAVYRIVKCELASTCKVRSSLRIIAWTSNKPRGPNALWKRSSVIC